MGPDREQSTLIEHKSKPAAKEGVISAKATLGSLKITDPATMVATTTIIVSKGTTSVAAAEIAVDGAGIAAVGTTEPEQGATDTTKLE